MKAIRAAVIVVSLVLATSMGGLGGVVAPVLLPSLWWTASSGSLPTRWLASAAAGVLAAETALVATVLVVRGNGLSLMGPPVVDWSRVWVIPVSVGVTVAAIFVLTASRWTSCPPRSIGDRSAGPSDLGPAASAIV